MVIQSAYWDGLFDSAAYLLVVAALFVLWRTAKRGQLNWSTKQLAGSMLIGFGLFNVVEGIIATTCFRCITSMTLYGEP